MTPTGSPKRGYSATKDDLRKRLARIEGQVRGIDRMVEEDRYCIDVLTQISAVQAALDKVALGLLDDHTAHCVMGADEGSRDEMAEELMAAVGRLLRRG
jgi:CsoR family transcriptional regulator, copper-sensing transcriptional repressor